MKKYTLCAVVILAVLIVAWGLLRGSRMAEPSQAALIPEKPSTALTAPPTEQRRAQAPAWVPLEPGREIPSKQQLEWKKMMRQLDQTPMDLFGIVLDEKDQPVLGAIVRISWNPLEGDTIEVMLKSDDDGRFAFTGRKGRYVSVDIKKEGYDAILSGRASLPFNFAAPPGEKGYRSNPDQPEVFRLRKKGHGVALVRKYLDIDLPASGSVKVDINTGRISSNGFLEFKINRSRIQSPFAWDANAKIQGGGFIKAEGQFPFEAPEEGYQEELTWSFPLNDQGRQRNIAFDEAYFVAFGSPRKYARIRLSPRADSWVLIMEAFINPDGGRNLEPVSPPSHPMSSPNPLDP